MGILDIDLGADPVNEKPITLSYTNRLFSTLIKGPEGNKKEKNNKFLIPMIQLDLKALNFKYDNPKYAGESINGLTIFESKQELGKLVLKLAQEYNIPEDVVHVLDPTNPNTASIDLMEGEADEVAESLLELVSEISYRTTDTKYFIEQIQRNHLTHYIYLLKMHDPDKKVNIDMLVNMYNDPLVVHQMHLKLKKRFPEGFESIDRVTNYDEYNYWQILKGIDRWFDSVIVSQKTTFYKKNIYVDEQKRYTKGIRVILKNIAENERIRQLLFNSSPFNFIDHVGEKGGVLLINTAKDVYGELSSAIGKVLLLKFSNAVRKRRNRTNDYHHVLIDECLDFLNNSFSYTQAVARIRKLIITCTTSGDYAALDRINESYNANFRNRFEFDSEEFGIETPWKCHVQQIEKGTSKVFYLK